MVVSARLATVALIAFGIASLLQIGLPSAQHHAGNAFDGFGSTISAAATSPASTQARATEADGIGWDGVTVSAAATPATGIGWDGTSAPTSA